MDGLMKKESFLTRGIVRFALVATLVFSNILAVSADEIAVRRGCRLTKAHSLKAGRRAVSLKQDPKTYQGKRRQLVVLTSFQDQAFKDADPLALWNRIFNEENFNESPFYGSVHDYFYAQSLGKFDLQFDLFYIPLNVSRSKYASTADDDENSKYLVSDLIDSLKTRNVDWSKYDWSGDGYVNQLLILYAGKGQNAGGGSNSIWPHQFWLSQHDNMQPLPVDDSPNALLVDTYCAVQELSSSNDYGTFGTICHEYSHCFGFPDFYYGSMSFMKEWDLMDYGNANLGGFCPPNYSAHQRMLLGWATPTELTTEATVTGMVATPAAGEAYLIRNDNYPNEYYILENRQKDGWDKGLTGAGLAIFHVDYDETEWLSGFPNTKSYQRYTMVAASNYPSWYSTSGWPYPYQDNNEFTDSSSPAATLLHAKADGSLTLGKPVTNIQLEDGVISFDFMKEVSGIADQKMDRSNETLYEFGMVRIVRANDGSIKKIIRRK